MKPIRLASFFCCSILLTLLLTVAAAPVTADTTVGGTISLDTTWTLAGSPYIVTSSITVQGADGVDEITTLTIEPGVVVRFNSSRYMNIGGTSGNRGALIAQGTAAEPILFTSNQIVPAPGDWNFIRFFTTCDDATTVMEHCVVEYGGASADSGTLYFYQASPTIRNITIRNSKAYGACVYASEPVIENCTFTTNQNYDLFYTGTVGGSVTGCTFNSGISVATTGTVSFWSNTINQNNAFPVKARADMVGDLSASTLINVDEASYLEVSGTTITRDATWTAAIPYAVTSSITVQGADGVDEITTLTIEPGAVVRFNSSRYMNIGGTSGNRGALIAQGTAAEPILFTSNQIVPAPGDWNFIRFFTTCDDATTVMEHCVVEYGGASTGPGALYLYQASPKIKNTTIRYSKSAGIYADGSDTGSASINCDTFYGNQKGIFWTASPPPEMHSNNFNGNTDFGIFYTGAALLNAEDNWWGDSAGPNQSGDNSYGNIDFDPWATEQNDCTGTVANRPPNTPSSPSPADAAVRVASGSGISLSWTGGDPNPLDVVTYDLYWGSSADTLQLEASALTQNTYFKSSANQGATYYWQVVAQDDKGSKTAGPVWHFTTDGNPPDLIISDLTADPAGHLKTGQTVIFRATIQNIGGGPAVDAFSVDFLVDDSSIGTAAVNNIFPAGATIQLALQWTYAGGDPDIDIEADSQGQVHETNEDNNHFIASLFQVADNTAPVFIGSAPSNGQYLQQVQQITITLADSQSDVDDASVVASFNVTDGNQQSVPGTVSESGDTFTFTPNTLLLADGFYNVSVTAADTYGNSQGYGIDFTIDTVPPAKPTITGGLVFSGAIEPRPVPNTANQFIVELTGTRELGSELWINGAMKAGTGDDPWAVQLMLQPGQNVFEAWLVDRAGNRGPSEWVDITLETGSGRNYLYDTTGRLKRIEGE